MAKTEPKPGIITGNCPNPDCDHSIGFSLMDLKGQVAIAEAFQEIIEHNYPAAIRIAAVRAQAEVLKFSILVQDVNS